MTSTALITREWNDKTFLFREDGYFNMTKAAQAFGKHLPHFMRSPDTLAFMDELSKAAVSAPLTHITKGRYGST